MAQDKTARCECVRDHVPNPKELNSHHVWPLGEGGPNVPENRVWLCPTAHVNVHALLREYKHAGGKPAWDALQKYTATERSTAALGYDRMTRRAL